MIDLLTSYLLALSIILFGIGFLKFILPNLVEIYFIENEYDKLNLNKQIKFGSKLCFASIISLIIILNLP